MISYTQETEVSCDEVDRLLDQFAELVQRGEDVKEVMPLVKNHVDMCPECREEFEALLRILQK
jgi:predicted anti-sigma-YlaC factor YlaD